MRRAPPRHGLSEADRAEWAAFARHLKRLPGRPTPEPPPEPPTTQEVTAAIPAAVVPDGPKRRGPAPLLPAPLLPAALLSVGHAPGGLDAASWKRLRSGRLVPQRSLDLHGQTAQRAYLTLLAFLHDAHAQQLRCVEIVTGRGAGETGGVLRRELPHWLNLPALRPLVLAAVHPHPANPGAVRLLLRRPR